MKKLLTSIVLTGTLIGCFSQDLHFSQIYNSPLTLSPALTGLFTGDQRATINFKDQWRTIGKTYRTYAVSYDQGIFKKSMDNAYIGIGGNVFADKAGDLSMGNTRAQLNLSGILEVNRNQMLSGGMYLGYSQYSIDLSKGQWDSQYSSSGFDPTLANNEGALNSDSWGHMDVGAGIAWYFEEASSTLSSYDAFRLKIGVSANHLNRPRLQYVSSQLSGTERQYMKFIIHANSFIGIKNTDLSFAPSGAVSIQGPSTEVLLGTMCRLRLREASKYTGYFKEAAWSIGAHYRVGDAIIPSIFFEADNFAIGISYDTTVSRLKNPTGGAGGFEVSLRFINPNPFLYKRSAAIPSL